MSAAQASLVLGTAGHIDHGKSSLVQALTGTNPDRLAEEKRRGITIELGFAQLALPSGRTMGVVDVPGHEKFVRHMVAGASGVDVALVAIAADDGIMPQTVEHLAVLELLGVRACVVALTKIDLVDEEWRAFVSDEIAGRLAHGPFADAAIIGVSSRTGEGLDDLRRAIDSLAAQAERTKANGDARLPVDRVFTVRGFGTVVTGTLWSGVLSEGDEVRILPSGASARVRSIQTHGANAASVGAGNRVAASLAGVDADEVHPGDFVCAPEAAQLSDRFDAEFTYLGPFAFGKPLKSGVRVHVAHGTREVLGRILLMDGKESINAGDKAFAQIRLEEPLPLAYRDRFIVRSYSPMHVIGGGMVLKAHPRRRTNLKPEERTMLDAFAAGDMGAVLEAHLALAPLPESAEDMADACGFDAAAVRAELAAMDGTARLATLGTQPLYVRPALLQKLASALERALLEFHSANPQATGLAKDELRRHVLPAASTPVFDALLDEGERRGLLVHAGGEVSHPKASAGARKREDEAAERLLALLEESGAMPPDFAEAAARLGLEEPFVRKVANRLEKEGRAVRVEANRAYGAAAMGQLRAAVKAHLDAHGSATAADLKDAMGTTRKFAMPLLEHFDETGFTRREGDARTLA